LVAGERTSTKHWTETFRCFRTNSACKVLSIFAGFYHETLDRNVLSDLTERFGVKFGGKISSEIFGDLPLDFSEVRPHLHPYPKHPILETAMKKLTVWTMAMDGLSDYDRIRYLRNRRGYLRASDPRRAVYTRQINIIKSEMAKTAHGRLMIAELDV